MTSASGTAAGAGAANGRGSANASSRTATGGALPAGALGVAQYSNTILTVYGCTRQGTQVLCDSDLSNQNTADTQLQSSVAWKDAFIIDDRGDRHQRSSGFFVNVDGDQRANMDVPYGQSARYIFVFNDVSPKVQQITLKSASGGLNVVNIAVTSADGSSAASGAGGQAGGGAPGQNQHSAPDGQARPAGNSGSAAAVPSL